MNLWLLCHDFTRSKNTTHFVKKFSSAVLPDRKIDVYDKHILKKYLLRWVQIVEI